MNSFRPGGRLRISGRRSEGDAHTRLTSRDPSQPVSRGQVRPRDPWPGPLSHRLPGPLPVHPARPARSPPAPRPAPRWRFPASRAAPRHRRSRVPPGPGRERRRRSSASSPPGRRNTPGPSTAWRGTGRNYSPSTTSRRLTGSTCGLQTPLSRLRHDTAANGEDQELPERENGSEPRAPTRHERPKTMVSATRLPSSGQCGRRREVHRWGGRERDGQGGRLILDAHTPDLTVTQG